ncbi:HNH endonuclease [Bacillus phage NotTheCreek]|uniref:HNH endonuclease n=1 Tax=Bacillus phage Kida TaxID=1873998 RepID=UPI0007A7735C|nr:HNH endonuclease [Bacillus phage Kida]YP_009284486.1 HNH endonuclease [Bacillus phage NotTheCreek]QDH50141.1 HNH endonuclease [Bacillus phage ALPS]ULF49365.1 HNH endonuclease [Bacillus phage MrBubbles]AMW63377.1 HNH homing endonuclease [Bacillus phage NotTheCreek]ANU79788.1 HNH endonuclease [Bacillus phage Kida]
MAITFKKGERQDSNPLYRRLRAVYKDMMHRCYKENNGQYHNYGAKGVTVCEEWQTLDGFFESIDKVDGWDLDKYLAGDLHLDKDKKFKGNKLYSPETCTFISGAENTLLAVEYLIFDFYALSPERVETKERNVDAFAREHGLNNDSIRACLKKKITNHKNWKFRLPDEAYFTSGNKGTLKEATDPLGNTYTFYSATEFADIHGLGRRLIGACLSGKRKHHKGWTFKTL